MQTAWSEHDGLKSDISTDCGAKELNASVCLGTGFQRRPVIAISGSLSEPSCSAFALMS